MTLSTRIHSAISTMNAQSKMDTHDDEGHARTSEGHEVQSQPDDINCSLEDLKVLDIGPVRKKRPSWRNVLHKVQATVQTPLPGPFNRTDLHWETTTNQGKGKERETQKATIPWDRLDDFLEGERSARQHPCVFCEESRQCMKKDDRKQIRAQSAIQEIRYSCQYGPQDYSSKYKEEVQKVFFHVLTQKKNSKNRQEALQQAQKIVDKATKEASLKPRSRKKGKVAPVPDLIVEAAEEEDEDQKCLKEAQDSLSHTQALLDAEVKPKRKAKVSKIQAGMSMTRGCQCNFVAKQLMVDETLCTIQFHCMDHYNKEGKPCHGGDFAAYPYAGLDASATIPVAESGYNKQEQIVKVEDPEKILSSIRTVLHEIEVMAVENMDMRHHVLAALHENKGRIASLKVKADAGLMHPLCQSSFQVGQGPKNLRRFKACSERGGKRRGTRGRSNQI